MTALIAALLPLVTNLTPVLIYTIQHIKAQEGKSTLQIIEEAGITLEANDRRLLEDLVRLGVNAGAP